MHWTKQTSLRVFQCDCPVVRWLLLCFHFYIILYYKLGLADGLGPEEEGGKKGRTSRRNSMRVGDGNNWILFGNQCVRFCFRIHTNMLCYKGVDGGGGDDDSMLKSDRPTRSRRNSRRIKDGKSVQTSWLLYLKTEWKLKCLCKTASEKGQLWSTRILFKNQWQGFPIMTTQTDSHNETNTSTKITSKKSPWKLWFELKSYFIFLKSI